VELTWSEPSAQLLEISAAGVSKGAGLAMVCAARGVDAGEVVVFGDMPNDLTMLTWAGRGVAMGNADPVVTAAADEVTLSHQQDGVAAVLERLLGEAR
jgi:hydroxymethylpyrimidine pyrophosphatase-like HAD family hydrolase